jgi:hypothetical protein
MGEVVQTTIDLDYPAMLRRHFLRLVIEKEHRRLGIQNTPAELWRYAQAKVAEFKTRAPQAFQRALEASKKSEEDYTRTLAQTQSLNARLLNEKAVTYALLTRDAVQISVPPAKNRLWVFRGMLEKEFGAATEQEVFAAAPGAIVRSGSVEIKVDQKSSGVERAYREIAGDVLAHVLAEPLSDGTIEAYFDWRLSQTPIRYHKD